MPNLTRQNAWSLVFWGALFLALFFVGANSFRLEKILEKENVPVKKELADPKEEKKNPFLGLYLEAKAAVVLDISAGLPGKVIFGFNENTPLPLASLTKLMTAAVAFDEGYGAGEKEKETVLRLLVASSNEAARTIEKEISKRKGIDFNKAMNQKARNLSLSTMRFSNESGVDEGSKTAGGYGSAKDAATLLAYDLSSYPDFFQETSRARIQTPGGLIENTNLLAGKTPGLVAGKTGTTDLSLGNLAVIVDSKKGKRYAISVLGSGEKSRFKDVSFLIERLNTL